MNKTIRKVGYAVLTEGSTGEITYGNPVWFKSDEAGGRSIGAEPIGDSNTIYADGLPIIVASANSGYTISLELISAVDNIEKDWFGNDEATESGIIEKGGIKMMPRFALLVAKETYKGDKLYEIDTYFDCVAARASRNDKTSEGNFDPQFPTFTITSKPRPDNDFVRYTSYADTLPESVVTPTVKAVKAAKSAVPTDQASSDPTKAAKS